MMDGMNGMDGTFRMDWIGRMTDFLSLKLYNLRTIPYNMEQIELQTLFRRESVAETFL
jgi:hypothetical protein